MTITLVRNSHGYKTCLAPEEIQCGTMQLALTAEIAEIVQIKRKENIARTWKGQILWYFWQALK